MTLASNPRRDFPKKALPGLSGICRAGTERAGLEGNIEMMNDMMGGGMMWGMGLGWVLVVLVLILAAAALIKYLFKG